MNGRKSVDLDELSAMAQWIAQQAALRAAELRAAGLGEVGTKSTSTDMVTHVDVAVERLIVELVQERRPGDVVLGEELGTRGESGPDQSDQVTWVVDPIDGTVNFVYGIPSCAVSVAAVIDGETVVGVVRNIATGEQWQAQRGAGAFYGQQRLGGTDVKDLDQALIATGFAYASQVRAIQGQVIARLLPQIRDIRRHGAASLDLCAAAQGRVDAYFERGLGAWDHAAAGLIAAEAGLIVSGLRGQGAGPGMVLAAPPAIYRQLHDLLVELDADALP